MRDGICDVEIGGMAAAGRGGPMGLTRRGCIGLTIFFIVCVEGSLSIGYIWTAGNRTRR